MLLACLLSVAALFVFSVAEFVAVTQILIYAGGVLVLIIFGIMLTSKLAGKPLEVKNANVFSGMLLGVAILLMVSNFIYNEKIFETVSGEMKPASVQQIGVELMTSYALPFEVAGILLLMALIGAGVFTSFLKEKKW
jgi:NADH-quinone oxidoreductase subunit J